jgi:anti-anti-sigma factor
MEIKENIQDNITVLDLFGKIDVNSAKTFQEKFSEIAGRGDKYVILNCENLSYVSSSGLRVFLMFLKHINKIGGKLVITAMNEIIYEVFEISGFLPIFNISKTIEEAKKEFL